MHLILTGATGLVGSGVLHHILSLSPTTAASKKLTRLSILSRRPDIPLLTHPDRPVSNTYTKIEVIPHTDFKSYPDTLMARLGPIESDHDGKVGVIWALGISQTEVKSTAEYIEITKNYAIEAAKAFQRSISIPSTTSAPPTETRASVQPHVNFVYVSGEGAQHTPGLLTPLFGKVKGETELALLELMQSQPQPPSPASVVSQHPQPPSSTASSPPPPSFSVYSVRPAGVDGHNQAAVRKLSAVRDAQRGIPYRLLKATLLPVLRTGAVMSNTLSPTEELGAVFLDLASGSGDALDKKYNVGVEAWQGRVVRNEGLRSMYRALSRG